MTSVELATSPISATSIVRRGLVLEALTIVHGVLESSIALAAGVSAGSVVLLGFGLDSLIELFSASIIIWRLLVQFNVFKRDIADRVGLRLVGASFIALGAYVTYDSLLALVHREVPHESVPGIVLAAFSVVAMPMLARAKRKLANDIGSSAMKADSVQSDLCAYLSAILLFGLGCNMLFGCWWMDPLAALFMVPIMIREGVQALQGHACGCAKCTTSVG